MSHTHTHTHTHTRTHTRMHKHTHKHMHNHMHKHPQTNTHAHTHHTTNTQTNKTGNNLRWSQEGVEYAANVSHYDGRVRLTSVSQRRPTNSNNKLTTKLTRRKMFAYQHAYCQGEMCIYAYGPHYSLRKNNIYALVDSGLVRQASLSPREY